MNKKNCKIYVLPHYSIVGLAIIYIMLITLISVLCTLFFYEYWWLVLVLALLIIGGIVAIKKGYLRPILVNSQLVKKGKQEYLWEDVRITICPSGTNAYSILLGTEYALNEKIIKEIYKNSFYTMLRDESLDTILRYAKHKIKFVDFYGYELDSLWGKKKLQQKIYDFNATIDE